uniref:Uncharacterized protein n=1 Tax=Lygus hesperus TaxID=30085 RepID=A0A0A9WSS9_LYGHE
MLLSRRCRTKQASGLSWPLGFYFGNFVVRSPASYAAVQMYAVNLQFIGRLSHCSCNAVSTSAHPALLSVLVTLGTELWTFAALFVVSPPCPVLNFTPSTVSHNSCPQLLVLISWHSIRMLSLWS